MLKYSDETWKHNTSERNRTHELTIWFLLYETAKVEIKIKIKIDKMQQADRYPAKAKGTKRWRAGARHVEEELRCTVDVPNIRESSHSVSQTGTSK